MLEEIQHYQSIHLSTDIPYITERMYSHEYVLISTKDLLRKIIKPEQESNLHLPIIGRTFCQVNYPIFSPVKSNGLHIRTFPSVVYYYHCKNDGRQIFLRWVVPSYRDCSVHQGKGSESSPVPNLSF